MNKAENYAHAVACGDAARIASTLSDSVKLLPPGMNQPVEGKEKTATMLAKVAAAVDDFSAIRTFGAENDWHAALFEGLLEGAPVQFIDQIHLDRNGEIDRVEIFLRPASAAQLLFQKMSEALNSA